RYWSGGPSAKVRRKLGDDDGCFVRALFAVRRHKGVLEHPEASHAWRQFGLQRPPRTGGWIDAGDGLGWTCCVEQGHYGHPARKATWLYYVGATKPPDLIWGPSQGRRLDEGFHSAEERESSRTRAKTREAPHHETKSDDTDRLSRSVAVACAGRVVIDEVALVA